jgi:hypothetical protein
MKKLIFSISLVLATFVVFAQNQPAAWSGASTIKHIVTPPINKADDLITIPSGTLLWTQGPGCNNIISSEVINSVGLVSEGADDFLFTSANNITAARWWFGVYNGGYSPFTTWTVKIYDDAACLPNNLIQQWTIPFALSHETPFCTTPFGQTYAYWADLTPSFTASANTKYWISIQTSDHVFPGQWGWDYITIVNGCEGMWKAPLFVGNPNFVPAGPAAIGTGNHVDFSFELYGTGIALTPISNWALFIGIGLILIFAVIRFRRLM